jgi:hypothetical protein
MRSRQARLIALRSGTVFWFVSDLPLPRQGSDEAIALDPAEAVTVLPDTPCTAYRASPTGRGYPVTSTATPVTRSAARSASAASARRIG